LFVFLAVCLSELVSFDGILSLLTSRQLAECKCCDGYLNIAVGLKIIKHKTKLQDNKKVTRKLATANRSRVSFRATNTFGLGRGGAWWTAKIFIITI